MKWAVAVTAAPREGASYLKDTIDSIRAAGWTEGDVYGEPGTPLLCPWPVHVHGGPKTLGPWGQFQRALRASLATFCDAVAIFQDDCRVARGCRAWLEDELSGWRIGDTGVVSLYTPEETVGDFRPEPGWFAVPRKRMPYAYGAVAVVIMRSVAEQMIDTLPRPLERTKTDYYLSMWCKQNGLRFVYHHPSLVRHVGRTSAIRTGPASPPWTPARHEGEFIKDCLCLSTQTRSS